MEIIKKPYFNRYKNVKKVKVFKVKKVGGKMNYMKIDPCDMNNGDGVRVSLFVSGCSHGCDGCFNVEAWKYNAGEPFTEETLENYYHIVQKTISQGLLY